MEHSPYVKDKRQISEFARILTRRLDDETFGMWRYLTKEQLRESVVRPIIRGIVGDVVKQVVANPKHSYKLKGAQSAAQRAMQRSNARMDRASKAPGVRS